MIIAYLALTIAVGLLAYVLALADIRQVSRSEGGPRGRHRA